MQKADFSAGADVLELLPFLQALVDTGSITRAGEALGMSQPAASRATARLRERFRDPLIVRAGKGWTLTPLAIQIAAPTRRALSAAAAVFEAIEFSPATSTRQFKLASTDYGLNTVVVPALAPLTAQAPSVGVLVDPWSDETIQRLERGELDAALYADDVIPPEFRYRPLFEDGYALVCRHAHPLIDEVSRDDARQTLRKAAKWPHFAPRYPLGRGFQTDDVYARLSLPSPQFVIEAPFFQAGLSAVAQANLVAILPQRSCVALAESLGLTVRALDDEALRFRYRIIWHERAHRDPGVRWLREALADAIR